MLLPQDSQIYAFTRRLENVELLVMANYLQAGSQELLRLRPWEVRVFKRTVKEEATS